MKKNDAVHAQVRQRIVGFTTAAFGFVAGLAWNDAITSFIAYVFPVERNTVLVKFIYAILLTVVLVIVTSYLASLFKKEDQ